MSTSGNIPIQAIKPIPHWMVLTLCWLFAILYGVWILPETVFIRHFCLVVGALLSLYVIYLNRRLLLKKEAAPIWLIGLLILWVTFHLFFIGRDFNAQWEEYTRIWKKIAVGSVFAIGLGIALISQSNNQKHTNQYWCIVFLGFLLPAITYFVKLGATTLGAKYGFHVPIYLALDPDHIGSRFGISKAWYVFYCLPAMAISIGAIAAYGASSKFRIKKAIVSLTCTLITPIIYFIEGDRLGIFFSVLLFLCGVMLISWKSVNGGFKRALPIIMSGIIVICCISWVSFNRGSEWRMLIADARVAIDTGKSDVWKYSHKNDGAPMLYPLNQYGERVSPSNYERIAWLVIGGKLIPNHPLGYGLLSLSFGALVKERWPDSSLSWSHSGWIDYTLGYGIPGFLLLFTALILAWKNSKGILPPWFLIGTWVLPILFAVFFVKEISSEIFFSALIFIILFSAALSLGVNFITKSNEENNA